MYKHLNSEQRYAIYLILKEYVPKRHCGCYSGKPLNDSTPVGTIQKMDKNRTRATIRASRITLEPYRKWIKTITTDNGSESFRHEYITRKLGIIVYFADPHAPWQKGGIENTNGLIRQYIPNGTDFKNVSLQRIKMIQRKINARPREKLNFLTPDEVVYKKTL